MKLLRGPWNLWEWFSSKEADETRGNAETDIIRENVRTAEKRWKCYNSWEAVRTSLRMLEQLRGGEIAETNETCESAK
jgi:hypothetical protein